MAKKIITTKGKKFNNEEAIAEVRRRMTLEPEVSFHSDTYEWSLVSPIDGETYWSGTLDGVWRQYNERLYHIRRQIQCDPWSFTVWVESILDRESKPDNTSANELGAG